MTVTGQHEAQDTQTYLNMARWPPSPTVEDEVTALSHEHNADPVEVSTTGEDPNDTVRGSEDQFPIIIEASMIEQSSQKCQKLLPSKTLGSECAVETSSSEDNAESTTSPCRTHQQPSRPAMRSKSVSFQEPISNSVSLPALDEKARSRPKITRIDTNINPTFQGGRVGMCHSPISSLQTAPLGPPPPNTFSPNPQRQATISAVEGSYHAIERRDLPVSEKKSRADRRDSGRHLRTRDRDDYSHHQHSHRRQSLSRRGDQISSWDAKAKNIEESDSSSSARRRSRRGSMTNGGSSTPILPPRRQNTDQNRLTPPSSRRQSQTSHLELLGKDQQRTLATQAGKEKRAGREPLCTSSAEESDKLSYRRRDKYADSSVNSSRRPSSHRIERPQLSLMVEQPRSSSRRNSFSTKKGNESPGNTSHPNYHRAAATMTTESPMLVEDENSFDRAFQANYARKMANPSGRQYSPSPSYSPSPTPPQTPRSERQSTDRFSNSASQHLPQRIPTAATHATQMLGSNATTSSTVAARSLGEAQRSPIIPSDYQPRQTSERIASAPQSRRPSVVAEVNGYARNSNLEHLPQVQNNYGPSNGRRPSFSDQHGSLQESSMLPGSTDPRSAGTCFIKGYDHQQAGMTPTSPNMSRRRQSVIEHSGQDPDVPFALGWKCPYPDPQGGGRDWYTIQDAATIDICPTCATFLCGTHLRGMIVPSQPRQVYECAMNKTGYRMAIVRALRQNDIHLPDLLVKLGDPPRSTDPCAGNEPVERWWFRVIDPATGRPLRNIHACAACSFAIELVFPELHFFLDRVPKSIPQERICTLQCANRMFDSIMDQFGQAAAGRRIQGNQIGSDLQPLATSIRKMCRNPICPRDSLSPSRDWHFAVGAPEFTVCKQCFDEIVWPLRDKCIARDISETVRPIPSRDMTSCQLYSDSMRQAFREAVETKSFGRLRDIATQRQKVQLRLYELKRSQTQGGRLNSNRQEEIERTHAFWRTIE